MAIQDYLRNPNKALTAKVETVEGTFEAPIPATDAIPLEDAGFALNPEVEESNEATGVIDTAEADVTGTKPNITGTLKLRGSGSVTVAPRYAAILKACGLGETIATILPPTGTYDVASGTTTTLVIDRTLVGNTSLPSTNAMLAALIGRPIELSVNPTTTRRTGIVNATITGNNVTITIGETLAAAMGATTEAKILPGPVYQPIQTVPPSISMERFLDGIVQRIKGVRGTCGFTLPGARRGTINIDMRGIFHQQADEAVPTTIDFSTLPPPPIWRAGRAHLNKLEIGATQFTCNLSNAQTQHPNPNIDSGFDRNIITKRDVRGQLDVNMALKATHDRIGALTANTKMPFMALLDDTAATGARVLITVPNFKVLDVGEGDRESIAEHTLPYQGVYLSPMPTVTLAFY